MCVMLHERLFLSKHENNAEKSLQKKDNICNNDEYQSQALR